MARRRWTSPGLGRALVAPLAALAVTACGGSAGNDPVPSARAPASASPARDRTARAPVSAEDPGFRRGAAQTDFEGREHGAHAVAVQGDGKLVVAGWSSAPEQEHVYFVLSRYRPAPTPGFGRGGKVVTDLESEDGGAEDVLVMGDGRSVAVGYGGRSFEAEGMAVMRYRPDGSPDPSYGGGDGYAKVEDVEDWGHECLHANVAALQPDGKLGAVRERRLRRRGGRGRGRPRAVRSRRPAPHRSFDGDGTQRFDFGHCAFATAVAVQGDGNILVGGGDGGCYEQRGPFRVARLNADGSFDGGFGRRGRQSVRFAAPLAWVEDLLLDARGRVVLVGPPGGGGPGFPGPSRSRGCLARLPSIVDSATAARLGRHSGCRAARWRARHTLVADGRIAVVGTMAEYTERAQALIAMYRRDGRLDRSFGRGGARRVRFGGRRESVSAVAVDAAGGLVVAGSSRFAGRSSDFGLARLADES